MPTIRAGATAALQSLRYYQTTAWLLAVALFTGIIATFPLASLFGRAEDWLGFRPLVQPVRGGDLGLPWTMHVAGPTAGQQEAVSTLGSLLLFALAGTILAGMTTVLTLGAARAGERRGERLIQRAVGAGRRTLAASAVTEMVLVALVPLLAGSALGMLAARAELVSWPASSAALPGRFRFWPPRSYRSSSRECFSLRR